MVNNPDDLLPIERWYYERYPPKKPIRPIKNSPHNLTDQKPEKPQKIPQKTKYPKKSKKSLKPEDLTQTERAYYRETWGFDPVSNKKQPRSRNKLSTEANEIEYYYQAEIPLENDPELAKVGMRFFARVEVDKAGQSHNQLILKRGKKIAEMNCIHTEVYSAPIGEILDLQKNELKSLATSAGSPVILPPWEHFAALKSFATGLATMGLLNGLSGLGPQFESGLLHALGCVGQDLMLPLLDTYFVDLVKRVPASWFGDQWPEINDIYPLERFFNNATFLDSLDVDTRKQLFFVFMAIFDAQGEIEGENVIIEEFSPHILEITLDPEFIDNLAPETQLSILDVLFWYLIDPRPRNRLLPAAARLFREGLIAAKCRIFGRLNIYLGLVPNPFELAAPRAVFDEEGFAVPDSLNALDSAVLREMIRELTINWRGSFSEESAYLPYQIARLLLEREGLSQANRDLLHSLVDHPWKEWKLQYYEALMREFQIVTDSDK